MQTLLIIACSVLFINFLVWVFFKKIVPYADKVLVPRLEADWQKAIANPEQYENWLNFFFHEPNSQGVTFSVWLERAHINHKDIKGAHRTAWRKNMSPLKFTEGWASQK